MRIALIHAAQVAMAPTEAAFESFWPDADRVNILDDSLGRDRQRGIYSDDAMEARVVDLARYAISVGAEGVLFTCSAFGAAIEHARAEVAVPVLKPNESMFEEAMGAGRRIGLLASFEPSLPGLTTEFETLAAAQGRDIALSSACAPEAMEALEAGDGERHDALLVDCAATLGDVDAIMLAQFSTARAAPAAAAQTSRPIFTSPESAVRKLRAALDV